MSARLPSSLQAAYVGALVFAGLIGCCAVYSGLGVAAQLYASRMMGDLPGGGDPQLARMMEMQQALAIVSSVSLVLQMATSAALAVGGGLGMTGRPIARPLMLGALGLVVLGVLFDVGIAVWSWSQMSDAYGIGAGSMGPEERRMMAMYGALGMAPTICWLIFKLGLVAAAASGMYSTEAKVFYARMGPEGLVRGPRE